MKYLTRPIVDYPKTPTPVNDRRRAPFKVERQTALVDLVRELEHLGATTFILEIDIGPYWVNLDGSLRKGARPEGPRVVISADTDNGPMRMACDSYDSSTGNLRAIGLTLTALRAVTRYGAATKGEQYTGWLALPAVSSVTTRVRAAWSLLEKECGRVATEEERTKREMFNKFYRGAAFAAHPDSGGTEERMRAVNMAREEILKDMYV